MTRHDANALLDETFGGEDGTSPIQFGREPHYRRHPSEKLVLDAWGRRYNREPDTRIPPVRLLNILLSVAFLEVMVILWALSELGIVSLPILAEAVMRP